VLHVVNAQSTTTFAAGEGQRLYDLLDGLNCFGNVYCHLKDFLPKDRCVADFPNLKVECDANGFLTHL
jgi:hypothetical protein